MWKRLPVRVPRHRIGVLSLIPNFGTQRLALQFISKDMTNVFSRLGRKTSDRP